jgi:hypothetical protein
MDKTSKQPDRDKKPDTEKRPGSERERDPRRDEQDSDQRSRREGR